MSAKARPTLQAVSQGHPILEGDFGSSWLSYNRDSPGSHLQCRSMVQAFAHHQVLSGKSSGWREQVSERKMSPVTIQTRQGTHSAL